MQSQPSGDPLLGTTVAGRYKVIKLLGEGGMGQVYLAEHSAIEKRIALKVLRAEYAHKGEIVTRFQQEAISASRIKHPNVLDVFDFGQLENGCFYLAMEFLEGNDLADELQRARQLTPARALPIAMQICRALSAAHAKGVVHRDMKPENVFLQRTGDGEEIVKIVDFGIAQLKPSNEEAAAQSTHRRLTRTGMIFGTPEYMAPEQASGKHADLRCDVYAVGIILFELFTGAVPFTGETFLGVLTKHLNEMPPAMRSVYPDLQLSPELEGVVQRTLAKDPSYRYQTMNELASALAATPEGQYAGLRGPYSQVMADGRGSVVPGAGQNPNPTAQQFYGNPSGLQPQGSGSGSELTDAARAALTMPRQDTGVESRAETQLGGEAATRPPTKSSGGGAVVLALLGVLVVGGGAAVFFLRGSPQAQVEPSAQAKPAPVEPPTPVAPEPPPAAPSTAAIIPPAPSVPTPSAPADVKLEVITDPPGATLMKNGFQVCDATPCEVTATVNETLELSGEKGPLKGKAKVLAQKDQKVTIKLAAPVAAPPKQRMCEVEIDGLKILPALPVKLLDVGIVGAGFAGAAAALFLAERGHRVTLYEEALKPEPVGAGILMQPSGLSVLADLGLLSGALERGSRVEALVCKTPGGRTILDLSYRDLFDDWYGLGMHRGALFELLHGQLSLRGVKLVTGASVRRSRLSARGIRPILFDGGEPAEHELLVVADGARSALRSAVSDARVARYPWGALWFVGRDPGGVFAGSLQQVADGATTLLGFLPCGLGPRREDEVPLVSLFWSVPVDEFSRTDFDLSRWKARVLELEPRAEQLLEQIVDAGQLLPASYFDVALPRFDAPRIVFIGDAAHATSPQLGQGTNLALEDARVLACCVSTSQSLQAGLASFSRARLSHVRYYQRASWGLTPFFQSRFGALSALRDLLLGPLCNFAPSRRLMLTTLAGVQRSFLGATLPLRPIRARLSRNPA